MESKNEVFLSWGAACLHTKYNFLLPDNGFLGVVLLSFLTLMKVEKQQSLRFGYGCLTIKKKTIKSACGKLHSDNYLNYPK